MTRSMLGDKFLVAVTMVIAGLSTGPLADQSMPTSSAVLVSTVRPASACGKACGVPVPSCDCEAAISTAMSL